MTPSQKTYPYHREVARCARTGVVVAGVYPRSREVDPSLPYAVLVGVRDHLAEEIRGVPGLVEAVEVARSLGADPRPAPDMRLGEDESGALARGEDDLGAATLRWWTDDEEARAETRARLAAVKIGGRRGRVRGVEATGAARLRESTPSKFTVREPWYVVRVAYRTRDDRVLRYHHGPLSEDAAVTELDRLARAHLGCPRRLNHAIWRGPPPIGLPCERVSTEDGVGAARIVVHAAGGPGPAPGLIVAADAVPWACRTIEGAPAEFDLVTLPSQRGLSGVVRVDRVFDGRQALLFSGGS